MKKKWVNNLIIFLVLAFLYLPIIVLIVFSFNDSKLNVIFEGFTFKWYSILFSNRSLLEALFNTLIVAVVSTVLSVLIGTISAIGLYKYDFKLKGLVSKLIYIPIVIPEIVLGISLLSVYTLIRLSLGMFSLILAHITFSLPFVMVSVKSSLEGINPYLEEASRDLGASEWETFLNITLPMIISGIMSGAMLSFILSMDDVVISYFTAGPDSNTLPLQIYSMIKSGVSPDVNALFSLMLLIIFGFLTIYAIGLYKRR